MKDIMKRSLAFIILLVLLPTFSGVAYAAAFIDYFKATPIIEPLSSSCWGAPEVGPRDQANGLEDKTMTKYCYWDGGIIKGPDGKYHMFASRWNQNAGHNGWFGSVAVHATSSNLYGPYVDQGVCWPHDQGGKGHNVFPFQLKDGRYAIIVSDTRPGDVFVSDSLDGPWKYMGRLSVTGPYASSFTMYNVCIMLRPDGRYEAIQRHGAIGISDNVLGPYTVSKPAVWPQVSGLPKDWLEDPVMWYSGDLYHVVVNKWDTRKAYHLTSKDGINDWKLESGLAYDPTANFIRYTNGTVNRWNKLERPNVYMENGHVVAMLLSGINVAKDKDLGNDRHGSKVIVVPFDGARFDADGAPPTPVPRSAYTQIEAESFYTQLGVQTEACTEGGENVGYIENGDYVVYKRIEFGSGAESFQARIASAASGGNIELRLDSITGPLIGTCPVTETGDWQTWADVTCEVSSVSGVHDLYLKFTGGSGYLFNLNWWKFSAASVKPTPTPTGIKGDANDDGSVNSIDFALLRLHLLGVTPLTGKNLSNADINGDGNTNSIDFALLRQYLLGIISSFG